jgi:hypothetical protein
MLHRYSGDHLDRSIASYAIAAPGVIARPVITAVCTAAEMADSDFPGP